MLPVRPHPYMKNLSLPMKTIYIISNDINGIFPTSLQTILCEARNDYIIYQHTPRELAAGLPVKPFADNIVFIILWDKHSYREGWLASLLNLRMKSKKVLPLIFVGLTIQMMLKVCDLPNVGIISVCTRLKDFNRYIDELISGKKAFVVSPDIMPMLAKHLHKIQKGITLSQEQ